MNTTLLKFSDDSREFVGDIQIKRKSYRIFYHSIINDFVMHEIVSHNYEGKVLLKNTPIDENAVDEVLSVIYGLPQQNQSHTLRNACINYDKERKERLNKNKKATNSTGRPRKIHLWRATFWVVKRHDTSLQIKPLIEKAYEKYNVDNIDYDSFEKSVKGIRKKIRNEWRTYRFEKGMNNEIYDSFKSFGEETLKKYVRAIEYQQNKKKSGKK